MAFNQMSGTVFLPAELRPRLDMAHSTVLSGNLSTSDASAVINIPRVSNATNNSLITNVDGDANTLTCESNLTFDGTSLSVIGDLTVTTGTTLYGPINLSSSTGVTITGSLYPSGSAVFSLGSTTQRWADIFVGTGSVYLGQTGQISSDPNRITMNKTLSITGDVSGSGIMSASAYYGDGSHLTNVLADNVVAEGPVNSIQFHDPIDSDLTGSSNLTFQNNVLSIVGGLSLSRRYTDSSITASVTDYYIGVGTTSNPVALTLPDAALMNDGQTYVVKDEGGNAHTNNITITTYGSQTIDDQNSIVLESPYASIQLYCNGTDKYFIG